jgi:hypothetical protein
VSGIVRQCKCEIRADIAATQCCTLLHNFKRYFISSCSRRYQAAVRVRLADDPPHLLHFAYAQDSFVDIRLQVALRHLQSHAPVRSLTRCCSVLQPS